MKPIKEVIENIKKYQKHFAGQIPDIAVEKKQAEEQTVNIPPEAKRSETQHADGRKPEKPVNGTIHDKSFDEQSPNEHSTNAENSVSSLWEKTLERVDTPLASKISKADVELKGNDLFLTLNGGHAVFEDAIRKNLRSIEKILSEISGRKIKIKIKTLQKKSMRKKEIKEKIMNEPLIKEAMELFEGRIVEITPLEKSQNTNNGGNYV
jgi:hypothetical protein